MQAVLALFVLCFAIFMGHAWPPFGSVLENLCMHMFWRGKKLRPKRLSSHHKRSEAFCANPQHTQVLELCLADATKAKLVYSQKRRWYTLPQAIIIPLFCMWSIQCCMLAGGKVLWHLPIEWEWEAREHIIIIYNRLHTLKNGALWDNKLPEFQISIAHGQD